MSNQSCWLTNSRCIFGPGPRGAAFAVLLIMLAVCVHQPPAAPACGPTFPSSIIFDDRSILEAPVAKFEAELDRISLDAADEFKAVLPASSVGVTQQSNAAEETELKRALAHQNLTADEIGKVVNDYLNVRNALQSYKDAVDEIREKQLPIGSPGATPPPFPDVSVPANLPAEFEDYLRSLIALRHGETDLARAQWQRLLNGNSGRRGQR